MRPILVPIGALLWLCGCGPSPAPTAAGPTLAAPGAPAGAPTAPGSFPAARAAPPATSSASPPPWRALRIATWNIAWLSEHDGDGEIPRRAADYARLRDYAARLDADIVAVQEVQNEAAILRVFDPAVYLVHLTGDLETRQRPGFVYRRGLEVVPYPDFTALAVAHKRRGADIGVRVGGVELRLLAVHLKSGCWGAPLDTDNEACTILRAQVPALEEWIDARARDGAPFAVVGDFNRRFTPGDRVWAAIDDGDPPEARLTDAGRGMRSRCWGGEHPVPIDHIVLSRQVARWLVPGSTEQLLFDEADRPRKATLSDHCPFEVTLDIGGRGGQDVVRR